MARNQKNRRKQQNNFNRPNFWGFLQNVLLASLNKGQLPGMFVGLYMLILIIKLPTNEVSDIIREIITISKVNSILGWVLAVIVTLVSYYLIKRLRINHTNEIKRITNKKQELQEKLAGKKLPSSNN
jgi:phosphotransferase system  glucose/maltose/N-acetylglucosamine-specific IIC component